MRSKCANLESRSRKYEIQSIAVQKARLAATQRNAAAAEGDLGRIQLFQKHRASVRRGGRSEVRDYYEKFVNVQRRLMIPFMIYHNSIVTPLIMWPHPIRRNLLLSLLLKATFSFRFVQTGLFRATLMVR